MRDGGISSEKGQSKKVVVGGAPCPTSTFRGGAAGKRSDLLVLYPSYRPTPVRYRGGGRKSGQQA